jgi:cytidyltransferase-like protein
MSPDVLRDMEAGSYRVIICIKKYTGVVKQLREMGVSDYVIYDTNMEYPEPEPGRTDYCVQCVESDAQHAAQPKKYHIGYIAGVFDLFHVGHLNMFRRAKEQCDYLIVGVVTDEGVRRGKKTEPFIPFTERIEMVRSCRYVDEAVEIPLDYAGSRDAYRLYHFDVQFSGSDYVDDPNWLAEREFLRKQGSELVFFPYTESTSSTRIKALIDRHLL